MRVVIGIPARMGSSRLPGKPMKDILGTPMIEHVYRRCLLSDYYTFVATCDKEIFNHIKSIDGNVIMTDPDITRPGLRVAQACNHLRLQDDDIVIIVQGDEPLITPEMITRVVRELQKDKDIFCAHMITTANQEDLYDPNEVKAVSDNYCNALYFSRSPIPSQTRHTQEGFKQLCVFGFTWVNLMNFNNMKESVLEKQESIEMLRALEYGKKVRLLWCTDKTKSVDNSEDLKKVIELMKEDEIYNEYIKKELK